MPKKIYLVLGHGTEELVEFSKRKQIPSGKLIVNFAICGRVNFMKRVCRIAHMLKLPEHAELFSNPIDNKSEIEELLKIPIRIYVQNDFYPQLSTNLFLDFEEKGGVVLMKSGVYRVNKIPLIDRNILPDVETFSQKLGTNFCVPFLGLINKPHDYTPTVHKELFKGNVFEPALAKGNNFHDYKKERSFAISDITDAVGDGIYYYIGCRALNLGYNKDVYNNIFGFSDKQQQKSNRTMPLLENASVTKSSSVSEKKSIKDESKKQRSSLNRRHRKQHSIL